MQDAIVTVEAFASVILLAILPGVMFLKIQYPRTKVLWTSRCLISRGVLSVRTINCRKIPLYDVNFKAVMIRRSYGRKKEKAYDAVSSNLEDGGSFKFELTDIPLENEKHLEFDHDLVLFHRIGKQSPLYKLTKSDFERSNICICLLMMGTDQLIQQDVANKVVYLPADIHWSNNGWWKSMTAQGKKWDASLRTSEIAALKSGQVSLDFSVFDEISEDMTSVVPVQEAKSLAEVASNFSLSREGLSNSMSMAIKKTRSMAKTKNFGKSATTTARLEHGRDQSANLAKYNHSSTLSDRPKLATLASAFTSSRALQESPSKRAASTSSSRSMSGKGSDMARGRSASVAAIRTIHSRYVKKNVPDGVHLLDMDCVYRSLLSYTWAGLLLVTGVSYMIVVLLFAFAVNLAPGDSPIDPSADAPSTPSFADSFFWSLQTLSTIGFGSLAPQTLYANCIATAEALIGAFFLAFISGVVMAKCFASNCSARVVFSNVAVVETIEPEGHRSSKSHFFEPEEQLGEQLGEQLREQLGEHSEYGDLETHVYGPSDEIPRDVSAPEMRRRGRTASTKAAYPARHLVFRIANYHERQSIEHATIKLAVRVQVRVESRRRSPHVDHRSLNGDGGGAGRAGRGGGGERGGGGDRLYRDEADAEMTVPMVEKWVELKVERSFNPLLSLNGEVRHVIDESSPLHELIDDPSHNLLLKTTISGLDSVFRKHFFATFVYSDEDQLTGTLHEEGASGAIKRGCRLLNYMNLKHKSGGTTEQPFVVGAAALEVDEKLEKHEKSHEMSIIVVDLGKFHEYEHQIGVVGRVSDGMRSSRDEQDPLGVAGGAGRGSWEGQLQLQGMGRAQAVL
jgi:hypothetical protein